jgi:hypothetical protein
MALAFKVSFFMRTQDESWSEVHWHKTATTFTDAKMAARTLALLRMAISGNRTEMTNIRLSNQTNYPLKPFPTRQYAAGDVAGTGQASIISTPSLTGYPDTGSDDKPETRGSTLRLQCYGDNDVSKQIYLGAMPDGVITQYPEGPVITGVGAVWKSKLDEYILELQRANTPWGFKTRARGTALLNGLVVQQYVYQGGAGSPIGAIVLGNATQFAIGQVVQVTNARMLNKVFRSINGFWRVLDRADYQAGVSSVYYLQNTDGVAVERVLANGVLKAVDYQVSLYKDIAIAEQTSRKRSNMPLKKHPGTRRRLQRI